MHESCYGGFGPTSWTMVALGHVKSLMTVPFVMRADIQSAIISVHILIHGCSNRYECMSYFAFAKTKQ